jgi:hypothetical protein
MGVRAVEPQAPEVILQAVPVGRGRLLCEERCLVD